MAKFNTGQSFADGDTVTGAKLNNITSQLNIYTGVISEQTAMVATVSTADQLLIADTDNGDSGAANRITVQKLFSDSLTNGTFASFNLTGNITASTATIGTAIVNTATISTATITSGTYSGRVNSTLGTISNFTTTLAGDFTVSSGTGTLSNSGVTLGTYGGNGSVPIISVDSKGRVTTMSTVAAAAGAKGGGTDKIFWENDIIVTTSYTISTNKNAVSAGPITVGTGTVTVQDGSVWTVV